MRFNLRTFHFFVLCCALAVRSLEAQDSTLACGRPPVAAADARPNLFTEQGEQWLGEAMADAVESEWRPVRDPGLSAHVQAIADRLVATLPATAIQFRVVLIDSAEVNGFSIAGGHIYLTRKLASAAVSDDELAGVIGHEVGHIASHQFAFETTLDMKRLLGITKIDDRADVYAKYHALLDAEMKDKHPVREETDEKQDEADRIGVYATAAAGYRPAAVAEFWDRSFFVKGKTGGKFSDFFGITKPNQKRLRGLRELAAALPAGCGGTARPDAVAFAQWHDAVVANQAPAENPGSSVSYLREVQLPQPLRMELDRLRFSPDGRSVLAQDESSIFVLSREPFALRYRIDAQGALPANFSPDSQSITFSTPGLHTEQWSVTEKKLIAAHEVLAPHRCWESKLAPDGRTLVCVTMDLGTLDLGLDMIDTASGQVVWEEKSWSQAGFWLALNYLTADIPGAPERNLFASYSADNKVLLLGSWASKRAFNLDSRTVVKVGNGILGAEGEYAFVGNDKIVVFDTHDPRQSASFSFPEGKRLDTFSVPNLALRPVTNAGAGTHVLVYGATAFDVGLADPANAKLLIAVKSHALDEYDGEVVTETNRGNVALNKLTATGSDPKAVVELPVSPLARLHAASLSDDGRYLAMSTRYRGGVWDLRTGMQISMLHGFTDAAWTANDTLYVDVAKQLDSPRHIGELSLETRSLRTTDYKVDEETHMRYGRLTDWKLNEKKNTWTLAMCDPATNAKLWRREFPEKHFGYTASFGDRDLIFLFDLKSKTAKESLKANSKLADAASTIKNKDAARLIQVIDGKTGTDAGAVVLEMPPNFDNVDGINRAGDLLYVTGGDYRTTVYSLASGKQVRQLFGAVTALDPETGRVCTSNRVGEALVYDAEGVELAHFKLGQPIRFGTLREHAEVLTVLTEDQRVRTLAIGRGALNPVVTAATSFDAVKP